MANKNRNLIIAYFPSRGKAEQAAEDLKHWDKQHLDLKLGGMGIITADEDGKLKTHKVGARAEGTGAKWGLILGAVTGVLSGGITLIGGAIAGLAAGTVAGVLFHKRIGMSDEDKERLIKHLKDGGAALAVMADDDEVEPTKFQLSSQGGEVESYNVPDGTMEELEEAADIKGVEELDEVVVMDQETDPVQETPAGAGAAVGAAAATAAAVQDDEDDVTVEDEMVDQEGKVITPAEAPESEVLTVDPEGKVVAAAATGAAVSQGQGDAESEQEAPEPVVPEEAAVAAAAVAAADDSDDSAPEPVVPEDAAIAAAAVAAADEMGDVAGEAQPVQNAVIHFKRYNEDYDGWGIHVWWGSTMETSWQQPLPPKGMDDFGLIFEVPLHPDAEGLAYIIHRGDEKDHWDDQYLDFEEHGREVWLVQNKPGYVDQP